MRLFSLAWLAAAALSLGILHGQTGQPTSSRKPFDQSEQHRGPKGSTPTILYHGGAVLTGGPVNVYVIYYGSVPPGTQTIIDTFFSDLATTAGSYYSVNSTYYDSSLAYIASTFNFNPVKGSVYVDNPPSQGGHVGSKTVPRIVANAINAGGLPADEHGLYFVLTAPDLTVDGFCNSFCAYHTSSAAIVSGKQIRFALVPDPGNTCGSCDGNVAVYGQDVTPNGDQGADEMTDSIMHELSEAVTDPDGTAWFTQNGAENGDLCNYNYGTPAYTAINGAKANVTMKGNLYLIQKIWTNLNPQGCAPQP